MSSITPSPTSVESPLLADSAARGSVTQVMQALLFAGAAALLLVWGLEWHDGVITSWDRWLMPLLALLTAGSALVMRWRPALEPRLRAVPVVAFNAYLATTLHLTLVFASGADQWYQVLSALYWVPLGYGCAFIFLPLRAAFAVSAATAAAVFSPMLLWWQLGMLPDWTHRHGPLLHVIAVANGMYLLLLNAVIRLRRRHAQTESRMELMRTLAATDVLTGLPNRRAMVDTLSGAMALAQRGGQPVSVALIDVDHFKQVNDRFGHAAGDAVLVQLGELMRTQLRASDVLARWGGEEFLLCAPGTSVSAADELAERIRKAVAQWAFPHGDRVTISVGLTQCLVADDVDTLLKRADRALYQAKIAGRDRIVTLSMEAAN